jgi:hypothetical protein
VSGPVTVFPSSVSGTTVSCPAGKVVIGGGYQQTSTTPPHLRFIENFPSGTTSWDVTAENSDPVLSQSFFAYALCANVGPP